MDRRALMEASKPKAAEPSMRIADCRLPIADCQQSEIANRQLEGVAKESMAIPRPVALRMNISHTLVETFGEIFDDSFIPSGGFWTVGSIKVSTKVASKASKANPW